MDHYEQPSRTQIAVVMTCHNRREKTVNCLRALFAQRVQAGVAIQVHLVDDGSSDGTAEAISLEFPGVRIIGEDGGKFWNGGMRVGFGDAMQGNYDYFLWLNDDTNLYPEALQLLLDQHRNLAGLGKEFSIVVGATCDPETRRLSYGGWVRRSFLNGADCTKSMPSDYLSPCDTFNGNCVLIPRRVAAAVGNLDPCYTHAMGDMDYGFRARKRGCTNWLAPGYVGTCPVNTGTVPWRNPKIPVLKRWRSMLGQKGLPAKEWFVFTRRHSGPLWVLYWINPYVKFWLRALFGASWFQGGKHCKDIHAQE